MSDSSDRELDLVLHGATGFAGRLVAEHLAQHAEPRLRVGLSGRSRDRLEAVRAALPERARSWPLLVADAGRPESLVELAGRTRVVATTVGPYARLGLPLVEACADAGTHYADLTGEVTFVRRSIDAAHERAERTGARIVHACGFDSVPSDLAVLLLAEAARERGDELTDTTYVLRSARGGVSGGTVDSARGLVDEARRDAATRRLLADPYALSPARQDEPALGDERDGLLPARLPDGTWTAPFVMGPFNTRVVRRSNALTGWSYGRAFRYREVMATGRGPVGPVVSAGVAAGLGGLLAGLALPPSRFVLDRVLPKPGTGPSERARAEGHFRSEVRARTTGGEELVAVVAAQGDPGYAATAVMLGESALALSVGEGLPERAGVLTPATGIGTVLADRLRARGFTVTVEPA